MIPASSNCASWSLFQKELRYFFSGAKPVSMAGVSFNNGGGGGQSAAGGRSGKIMSVYGNQQKIRNFEKIGTKLGQNMIHGDPIINVSIINGKPTRAFNFKLTSAILALRVCKPEGGRRIVTCLGAKEFSWPKDLSGGPKVTNQIGGLDKAQPMASVYSKSKGILVKPNPLQASYDAPSTWVIGKSSRGRSSGVSELPVTAAMLESEQCASALNVDPLHVASVVTPSIRTKADHSDKAASATEASKFGFIGEVVTNRGIEDENGTPMAGDSSVGLTARPMGTGIVVSSHHRHQGANQNQFSQPG
ncbi:hypothetical protein CMV_019889 [Castanea mollissima]|uniref:Uncharacterized protein n=1 Tax=Castanea mollissima TaxID=60419 RepID=A0A8J4QIW2_9ROSI|nr:hypothetical protein CMV_019889 [Castanea mollissima]